MLNLLTQKELNDLFGLLADPFIAQFKGMYIRCPTPNCDNVLFKKTKPPNILDHIRKKREGKGELNSDDEEKLIAMGDLMKKPDIDNLEYFEDSSVDSEEETDGQKKREFVFCECCGHDFCFDCKKNHYGDDCAKDAQKEEIWKAGILDSQNCPACTLMYERRGGCQHMTCGYCHAHFCNICLKVFPGDESTAIKEIYEHLIKVHGGIQVDQPLDQPENIGDIF